MRLTPAEAAIVIAHVLKESGQTRARLSAKTLKRAGRRKRLHTSYLAYLTEALSEYGWTLCELGNGGYGAIRTRTLEAAKAVTLGRYISTGDMKRILEGSLLKEWERDFLLEEGDFEEDGNFED